MTSIVQAFFGGSRMETFRSLCSIGVVAVMLVGCAGMPDAEKVSSVPVTFGGNPKTEPYTLSPGDDINVRFQFYADLNDVATLGPDGHVALQLVGDVDLAGLTVPEASDRLNQRYAAVIKQPTVSVAVKSYALQQIYVDGQVNSPGLVRSTQPLTLTRALAQAGGLKLATAKTGHVLIVRRKPDGAAVYYEVDLGGGLGTGDGQDPLLKSYDLVYVPQTAIGSVADFVSNTLLKIAPYAASFQATHAIP